MPKKTRLPSAIPIRVDPVTGANIQAIINRGLASDRSAALRVASAIVARLLNGDPHIYAVIGPDGLQTDCLFGTKVGAIEWLRRRGAVAQPPDGEMWIISDEDKEAEIWYNLISVVPK